MSLDADEAAPMSPRKSTPNQRLWHALAAADLRPADLAERLQVDEKTVLRWISGECRPYRFRQYRVAELLRVDRRDLWPDAVSDAERLADGRADLVAVYPNRLFAVDEVWEEIWRTPGDIEICTPTWSWAVEGHPLLLAHLNGLALEGHTIRVCLRDPDDRDGDEVDAHDLERAALSRRTLRLLDPLLDQERALHSEIRLHHGALNASIYRYGTEMIVHQHLDGVPDTATPLWHLRRVSKGGLFDTYLTYLRHIWQRSTVLPKHHRDMPLAGPHFIPPELLGADPYQSDAERNRNRRSYAELLADLGDPDRTWLYQLPAEIVEITHVDLTRHLDAKRARRAILEQAALDDDSTLLWPPSFTPAQP